MTTRATTLLTLGAAALLLGGCQTVQEKLPSVAHTHIGHALTGWVSTPDNEGLFVVAEKEAATLLDVLEGLSAQSSPAEIRAAMTDVAYVVDINERDSGPGLGYGLEPAFRRSMDHLTFAASSPDATDNVISAVAEIEQNSGAVTERIEIVALLAEEVEVSAGSDDVAPLLEEMQELARHINYGVELDGEAPVGSRSDEYGLAQLRDQMADMIATEDPRYVPVAEKYLMGLVRLSSGEWTFAPSLLGSSSTSNY